MMCVMIINRVPPKTNLDCCPLLLLLGTYPCR